VEDTLNTKGVQGGYSRVLDIAARVWERKILVREENVSPYRGGSKVLPYGTGSTSAFWGLEEAEGNPTKERARFERRFRDKKGGNLTRACLIPGLGKREQSRPYS